MESYKSGSHTVGGLEVPLGMDYEVPVSGPGRGHRLRCRELLREIARSKEMLIYAGSINRDHVHMLIGIPPQLSVSEAEQYLKGRAHTGCSRSMWP
jgi:putative transposase